MKKSLMITGVVAGLLVLLFAFAMVNAAPPAQGFSPFRQANLTEAQKEELAPYFTQMTDLRKQMFEVRKQVIQKQVEFGNLTQEQADQCISRMQERIDQGFTGPGGMGRGAGRMSGGCTGQGPRWQQQQ